MLEDIRKEGATGKTRDLEWQEYMPPPHRKYTATLKLYRKDTDSPAGVITKWKRLRIEQDPETKKFNYEIFTLTIRYDGGREETMEIPVIGFLRFNEYERVDIIEMKEKKMQMSQGTTNQSRVSRDDIGNELIMDDKTGVKVPLIVIQDATEMLIRRPNGEQFWIGAQYLNG